MYSTYLLKDKPLYIDIQIYSMDYSTLTQEELVKLLETKRSLTYKYTNKYHKSDKGKLAKARASRKYYLKRKAMSAL
jgi:hypothetical protein